MSAPANTKNARGDTLQSQSTSGKMKYQRISSGNVQNVTLKKCASRSRKSAWLRMLQKSGTVPAATSATASTAIAA